MYLKLRNPLCIFDLETTGTNITQDRIVEMSLFKWHVDGKIEKKHYLINPERPIPMETSLIHGIYDDDVKDAPTFKSIASELAAWLKGADLGGFNCIKFDIPMLVESFLRENINFDISKRKIVDAQKIFHMMEKRNLAAAYTFYCNKTLKDAHSAEADTQATLEVIDAMIEKYEGQHVITPLGKDLGVIENDIEKIHQLFSSDFVDLAGRLARHPQKGIIFNFGKYKNRAVTEVFDKDPSYYDWMMNGDFPQDTKRKLTEIRLKGGIK